ncbi:hypothetical protein [Shouchella clausii]|uniref:hypothetical protein n=1 Tax=Shouchella clausii TaxID=79880 RepID=UPI000BA6FEDA|nr:hypothetical protein [Shouchella clausii]PAE96761.1 hypothetical protein CHH71_12180 [Shouchella clausii]
MSWTKTFIESLKEWDGCTQGKHLTLNDLAFYLGLTIGGKTKIENIDKALENLEGRILYLVTKESIIEKFLIESLISYTTEYLASFNNNRGYSIIRDKDLVNHFEQEGIPVPESLSKGVERLESLSDVLTSEYSLAEWERIIATNFSRVNRRLLFDKDFKKSFKAHQKFYESLSEEDKNKTVRELLREKRESKLP